MPARKPSRDYSTMTREEAVRHFGNRTLKIKTEILALPTAEKLRLAADMIEGNVLHSWTLSIVQRALSELQAPARG